MAKQINTTLLGVFVLGAAALALAATVFFGSGKWFQEVSRYVVYFPESVQGLKVGADVVTHGVRIGSVINIKAVFVPTKTKIIIPVYIEVERQRIQDLMPAEVSVFAQQEKILESGLQAQLITESLVTGQRVIALSFNPGTKSELVGADTSLPEIPSQASSLERISNELERIPLDQIMSKVDRTLSAVEEAMTDLPEIVKIIKEKLNGFNSNEISTKLERSLDSLTKATNNINEEIEPLGSNANKTLNEISAAARELRQLAELLQRQPESLIKGKK